MDINPLSTHLGMLLFCLHPVWHWQSSHEVPLLGFFCPYLIIYSVTPLIQCIPYCRRRKLETLSSCPPLAHRVSFDLPSVLQTLESRSHRFLYWKNTEVVNISVWLKHEFCQPTLTHSVWRGQYFRVSILCTFPSLKENGSLLHVVVARISLRIHKFIFYEISEIFKSFLFQFMLWKNGWHHFAHLTLWNGDSSTIWGRLIFLPILAYSFKSFFLATFDAYKVLLK